MNPFIEYRITSPYGNRKNPFGSGVEFHKGIDLVKSHRAPIHAFVGGLVTHAREGVTGSGFGNYGITVAIRDKYGSLHCYAHLDSTSVAVGDVVEAGQEVGKQGTTGMSTGSHLHYEVRKMATPSFGYGTHVDPTKYLQDYLEKEEELVIAELIKKNEALQKRVESLEAKQAMSEVPDWAKDAVEAALQTDGEDGKKVLAEATGSYDFYRFITLLKRLGLLKKGK